MLKIPLNIQKFANSGTCYTNIADDSRFRVDWQTVNSEEDRIANNRDIINWQLYAELGHNYYSNAVRVDYVNINGQNVFAGYTWSNLYVGHHQLSSGTLTIAHNEDGNKNFNINLSGWTYSSNYYSGSQNFDLNKINRYAVTNSASGNNIEEFFSVNYTKYVSSYKYKLRISIPEVILLERIDYNTSGASFKLSQETIDSLYDRYGPLATFNLGFSVETWNNEGTSKLSDGNEKTINCKTDSKGRIRINNEWKNTTLYVRINNEWKKATPHIRINNEWKRGR